MRARREAFTLVELLTALTVFSTILGTMMLTLHAMRTTSRGFTQGIAAATQQERFATQLRLDTHQARNGVLKRARLEETADTLLQLTLADSRIVEYRLFEDRIERRARSGEAIVHRDSFVVSPLLDKGWSLDESRPFPLLTVQLNQIAAHGSGTAPTLSPVRVNAALRISTLPTTTASSSTTP